MESGPRGGGRKRPRPHTTSAPSSAEASTTTHGNPLPPGVTAGDGGSIQSGCSVKSLHDIISRFDDQKKMLVESIGFGGLLKFAPIKTINRRFCAWLMGSVDVPNSCLVLSGCTTLKFFTEDIGLVFGIPCSGMKVSDAGQLDKGAKEKLKMQCWPLMGKDQQSIKAVEEVVDGTYPSSMSPAQEDAFIVAFVVFVMSTLFVPGAKHDYAHVDYWGALTDPSVIKDFNWAAYVHKRLLISAAKYKADIDGGSRSPVITGCYMFLQVFYLDNLEIEEWGLEHSVRPRISYFTHDRIRNMIAADTYSRQYTRAAPVYGRSKVRSPEQSSYTWAGAAVETQEDTNIDIAALLWDAVISLITILDVPLAAAGPLYLAAMELLDTTDPSSPRSTIESIAILLRIAIPFRKGFNYNFDLRPESSSSRTLRNRVEVSDHVQHDVHETESLCVSCGCSCNRKRYDASFSASDIPGLNTMVIRSLGAMKSIADGPSKRTRLTQPITTGAAAYIAGQKGIESIEFSVVTLMSKFYLLWRRVREHNRLDLNHTAPEADHLQVINSTGQARLMVPAKNPWELGENWGVNMTGVTGVHTSPIATTFHKMPKIVGYNPKYIEVLPDAARDQRIGLSEMEMDMLDAMMRCFRQKDDELYAAEGRLRWRHYFESDILAAILAGSFDVGSPSVRSQFIGAHLAYDIYNCSVLFFPVILQEGWACFAWNLRDNKIVVFDPSSSDTTGVARSSMYNRIGDMLKTTLCSVIPTMIPGWDHLWNSSSVARFHFQFPAIPGIAPSNRTGVLCAYFCKCFDGHQLRPQLRQEDIDIIADKLFTEVAALLEAPVQARIEAS